jgi:hypothetical protein
VASPGCGEAADPGVDRLVTPLDQAAGEAAQQPAWRDDGGGPAPGVAGGPDGGSGCTGRSNPAG